MSAQLEIDWGLRFQTLADAFEKFHADNPHVWDLFRSYAWQVKNTGRAHYSARAIVEPIRWHKAIETKGGGDFKINNNHVPFYARKLSAEDVNFKGFFRDRTSQADFSKL